MGLLAGGLLVGASLTFGKSSSSSSPVTACVKSHGGKFRVVKSSARCRHGERRMTWNLVGPTGPAGVAGTNGPRGDKGPRGDRGDQGSFGWDSLDGMACVRPSHTGTITVTYDSNGYASLTC